MVGSSPGATDETDAKRKIIERLRSTGFSDDDFVVVDAVCGVVEDVDEFDEMRIDEESKIIEEQHEYEEEQAWLSYLEEQYAEGASKI